MREINKLFLIAELDNGKMHQVLVDEKLMDVVVGVITKYYDGKIKLLQTSIDTIAVEDDNKKNDE